MSKKNIISDKADKASSAKNIKNSQKTQFSGEARGVSLDECPLIPIGAVVYLRYNLQDNKAGIVGVKQEVINKYFTVIGVGGTAKSVNLSDKIILKPDVQVDTFDTAELDMKGYKFHSVYDYEIAHILK